MIDATIEQIKKKYLDTPAEILDRAKTENQREELIHWISDADNNVKVIIAFSGGKDSVAMVLYCLFVLKIPKENIELWHHEVDGMGEQLFDWKCTPSYCRAFAKEFGVTILFSYANGGILREIYRTNETIQSVFFQETENGVYHEAKPDPKKTKKYKKIKDEEGNLVLDALGEPVKVLMTPEELIASYTRRKFPAVNTDLNVRWCSWIAKIGVMNKAINNMPKYKNANLCILTGERRLESKARSKYNEIEPYRSLSKARRAIAWRPIIDWAEEDVWAIMKAYKVQPHPCYLLGWNRCSCQLCIFGQADVWASVFDISPEKVVRINEIENDLGFTMYHKKDIWAARISAGVSFIPEDMKARWMDEALGEFVSPIIVEGQWQIPAGAFKNETMGAS